MADAAPTSSAPPSTASGATSSRASALPAFFAAHADVRRRLAQRGVRPGRHRPPGPRRWTSTTASTRTGLGHPAAAPALTPGERRAHGLAARGSRPSSTAPSSTWASSCPRTSSTRAATRSGSRTASGSTGRPREIEPVYLEYLAKDVVVTVSALRGAPRAAQGTPGGRATETWGYVSAEWLREQVRRWGRQTHHIQLKAAVVLRAITANGLHLDLGPPGGAARRAPGRGRRAAGRPPRYGYLPRPGGSDKALQAILGRLEATSTATWTFPRTPTGALRHRPGRPGTAGRRRPVRRGAARVPRPSRSCGRRSSDKMGRRGPAPLVRRPEDDRPDLELRRAQRPEPAPRRPRSGRASSRGPGHVFLDADYAAIEMATLAQACLAQFGLRLAAGRGHQRRGRTRTGWSRRWRPASPRPR